MTSIKRTISTFVTPKKERVEKQPVSPISVSSNCGNCALRQFDCFSDVSSETAKFLQNARKDFRKCSSGMTFLYEGDIAKEVFTLFNGWAYGYALLEDGRRQVLNIYLPGDAIGLSACCGTFMDHNVEAVGNVQLCVFDASRLRKACKQDDALQDQIIRLVDVERINLQRRLINIGCKSSPENLAHLLYSLYLKLESRGLTYGNTCLMPLSQTIMADALGLSPEHLNRLLRQLREDGLVSVNRGKMVIHDKLALAKIAGTDDTFPLFKPLL